MFLASGEEVGGGGPGGVDYERGFLRALIPQAIITLLKSVKADAEGDEARFYIDNLMDQFTREDLSQPIIQATYEPDRQKRGANRASVSNLLG